MRSILRICSFAGAVLLTSVFAPAVSAQDITIPAGNDFLYTQPGTFANLPALGIVPLVGNPVLQGGTDTEVSRLADADATTGTAIGTQLVSLNLLGTGTFSNLSITLDPTQPPSTGTMSFLTVGPTVPGTEIGGTITDTLTVFFEATLSGVVVARDTKTFTSTGTWEAFLPAGANEVTDFKIIIDTHVDPQNGVHIVSSFVASVPEPSSWILCAIGGLVVPAYAGWRRRQTRVGQ